MLCRLIKQKKVQQWVQWGTFFLGLVMLGTCLALSWLGRLEGAVSGFYMGAGTGLTVGGLGMRLADRWRRRTAERDAQADLELQDERNQEINRRAALVAGAVQLLALCGVMLAAFPLNRAVFWLALALVLVYGAAYLLAFVYFWRKL